jgi:hypothetical protein
MMMQIVTQQSAFDASGRALPLPEDEERRRSLEAIRALDDLLVLGDEEEERETFAELVKAVDQDRMSDRRRFAE